MTEIVIPFNGWSKERLAGGRKTSTSRTKIYGSVGDTFIVDDVVYELISIHLEDTDVIIRDYWRAEGAYNPEELVEVLKTIFARAGRIPDQLYLHEFRRKLK